MPDSRLANGSHWFPVRVYWEDTDALGIVYHAGYLRFAERARTEMLRLGGVEQRALNGETGLAFTVTRMEIDFRQPAMLDDLLEVETRVTEVGGASLRMWQSIRRGEDRIVELAVRLAVIGPNGRPTRIPPSLRDLFTRPLPAASTNHDHSHRDTR